MTRLSPVNDTVVSTVSNNVVSPVSELPLSAIVSYPVVSPVSDSVVALLPVDELDLHARHGRAHTARALLVRRHASPAARGLRH